VVISGFLDIYPDQALADLRYLLAPF